MPKFFQAPIAQKPETEEIDPKVVAQYQKFIEKLEDGHKGYLQFDKNEAHEMNVAKTALDVAAKNLKKFVRVRKKRGVDFVLVQCQMEFSDFL